MEANHNFNTLVAYEKLLSLPNMTITNTTLLSHYTEDTRSA